MLRSLIALLILTGTAFGQEVVVPFRLSKTQHIVVRTKIDGKGPFHFVIDTGCPALVISTEAAKKAGLASEKGVAVVKQLEFEGGLKATDVKARVETPFQIDGMNSMGLPGIELHGLMGYTVLAKYRIAIDLERERMTWTPLAFEPPPLEKLKLKGNDGSGIELLGGLVKMLSKITGLKPAPPTELRGFAGLTFDEKLPRVAKIYADTPAAAAGIKAGDEIAAINGRSVAKASEAAAALADLRVNQNAAFDIVRDGSKLRLTMKLDRGF